MGSRRKRARFLATPRFTAMEAEMSATSQPLRGSYLMPSLEHATVADAMHPGIVACAADAPITEVARLMAGHHVHCIAVMGISSDTHGESLAWGIISDVDLVRSGIRTSADEIAGAMALEPVITVELTTPLREAGELMLAHDASHVIVVDGGTQRPVGILSTLDIAGILGWGEA